MQCYNKYKVASMLKCPGSCYSNENTIYVFL